MKVSLNEIPSFIKSKRLEKGLTQAELSSLSGVSQQMISQLENGNVNATLKTLVLLLNALGQGLILHKKDGKN